MKNSKEAIAVRFSEWVAGTGLSKVDLAKKMNYPRTSLYAVLNTGVITRELYTKILEHFPDTDMSWLLNGTKSLPGASFVQEPVVPYSRKEKVENAAGYVQRDLLQAQLEVAAQMKRIGDLLERMLQSVPQTTPAMDINDGE